MILIFQVKNWHYHPKNTAHLQTKLITKFQTNLKLMDTFHIIGLKEKT